MYRLPAHCLLNPRPSTPPAAPVNGPQFGHQKTSERGSCSSLQLARKVKFSISFNHDAKMFPYMVLCRIASEISLSKWGRDVVRSDAEVQEQVARRKGRGPTSSRRGHSRARRVKLQVRQILTLDVVRWLNVTVNPYNVFFRRELSLVRRTNVMMLTRFGPQVHKKASWFIKNAYWVLIELWC